MPQFLEGTPQTFTAYAAESRRRLLYELRDFLKVEQATLVTALLQAAREAKPGEISINYAYDYWSDFGRWIIQDQLRFAAYLQAKGPDVACKQQRAALAREWVLTATHFVVDEELFEGS